MVEMRLRPWLLLAFAPPALGCGGAEESRSPDAAVDAGVLVDAGALVDGDAASIPCGTESCAPPNVCIMNVFASGPCDEPGEGGVCGDGDVLRFGCCAGVSYKCGALPLEASGLSCGGPPSCKQCFIGCPCGPCEISPGVFECDCFQS